MYKVIAAAVVVLLVTPSALAQCEKQVADPVLAVTKAVGEVVDTEEPAPPNLAESYALSEELKLTRQGIGGWDAPFQEDPPIRNGVDTIFVFSPTSGLRPYLVNYYDRPAKIRLRDQWYAVEIGTDGTWSVPGLTHQLGSAHPATEDDIARDTSTLVGYVRTEKGSLFLITIPYF